MGSEMCIRDSERADACGQLHAAGLPAQIVGHSAARCEPVHART